MEPDWLHEHRNRTPYAGEAVRWQYSRWAPDSNRLLADEGFNSHELNDGAHVSPFDEGRLDVGLDNLRVRLLQGVDEAAFKRVLSYALRATTGIHPDDPGEETDWDEMMKGGLQSALETQTIVFEVTGASRALTHQLVRSRRAGFHQQSQRATWYGDRPNFRMPNSIVDKGFITSPRKQDVQTLWEIAIEAAWVAYRAACDEGISYQDARYILPEGTTNYILCEYTIREFIAVFAYRGCSMFLWEMVGCMRKMREALLADHPWLEPYVKISCEKAVGDCDHCGGQGIEFAVGQDNDRLERPCSHCGGDGKARKCTFQGWENVEGVCDFPWAKQSNRVFLPQPRLRIGG